MAYFSIESAIFMLSLAGVDDGQLDAVGHHQHPRVTRLPAAQRVKHGAVQHDALRRDGRDGGGALGEVGVLAEEVLGHAGE